MDYDSITCRFIVEGLMVIAGSLLFFFSNIDWVKTIGFVVALVSGVLLVYQLIEIGGGNLKRGRDSS